VSLEVRSLYRGWLITTEASKLFLVGEGDLMKRLERDWERYGPDARIRFFSASAEFPAGQLITEPWKGAEWITVDRRIRTRNFDLATALVPLTQTFLHLEIQWRR
jgi:hypothetical protein